MKLFRKPRPHAVIVDIESTVAWRTPNRHPCDWVPRWCEDLPNRNVITALLSMREAGFALIVTSGRMEVCYEETLEWLKRHRLHPDLLLMRPNGDYRPEEEIGKEMFEHEIKDRYDVVLVFDDRPAMTRTWHELGAIVARVAPHSL